MLVDSFDSFRHGTCSSVSLVDAARSGVDCITICGGKLAAAFFVSSGFVELVSGILLEGVNEDADDVFELEEVDDADEVDTDETHELDDNELIEVGTLSG